MVIVNVHQAKTQLSRLLAQVEAGEEVVVVTRASDPAKRCSFSSNWRSISRSLMRSVTGSGRNGRVSTRVSSSPSLVVHRTQVAGLAEADRADPAAPLPLVGGPARRSNAPPGATRLGGIVVRRRHPRHWLMRVTTNAIFTA